MKKRIIISAVIAVIFLIPAIIANCTVVNHHYTYIISPIENRSQNDYRSIWFDDSSGEFRTLSFDIIEKTSIVKGYDPIVKTSRRIYTEPYDLVIRFYPYNNDENEKIIFNKIIINTKKDTFNLRDKIKIIVEYKLNGWPDLIGEQLTEEETLNFKNSGIIEYKERKDNYRLVGLFLLYEDIEVQYKKDKYFDIEFDLTYIKNNITSNANIVVPFQREHIKDRSDYSTLFVATIIAIIYKLLTIGK
jgi:hypothetical protein